jgi:hypothetical protein
MYPLRNDVDERSKAPLGGENLEEGSARRNQQRAELMEWDHARAFETLLTRIMELHIAGRTADEIAAQVLTTEPENAMFRAAMLVEIILHYARRSPEENNQ